MGLLDWLTDGGGSLWDSGSAKSPFIDATNKYSGPGGEADMGPPIPPQPPAPLPPDLGRSTPLDFQRPEFKPPGAPPPQPGADGMSMPPGMGPMEMPTSLPPSMGPMEPPTSMPPGMGPPGIPLPTPRPAAANQSPTSPPGLPPLTPGGATDAVRSYESAGGGGPVQIAGAPTDTASTSGLRLPDMKGGGGLLGALGVDDQSARRFTSALGKGLTAAGNSSGKSPFQAFASGAGAGLEGGEQRMDKNNEQTHKYLNDAIRAQAAGDEVGYKTNYLKYLQARLKADTEKAANGTSRGQASNSPQQLYLSAIRATNSDPSLKGYNDAIRAARATGDQAAIAKAQAELEAKKAEVMNGHFGRLGIDPQTAAQMGQQPGMSDKNPIDPAKQGITSKNITQKLQPGQFYRNPKDGKVYQFTGGPGGGKMPTTPTQPEPANPLKPERGTRAESTGGADENEEAA
jgi:hypothetical protein